MTDADRIANLEGAVRNLARQIAELRAEVRGRADDGAPAAAPAPELPSPVGHERPAAATPPTQRGEERPAESWAEAAAAAVRGVIDPVAPAGAGPLPTAARRPSPSPAAPTRRPVAGVDLESMVGRYGTMALAALTIIMAVGAFLSWAVEHVRIGAAARVALGAALAALIAAVGWWLRVKKGGGSRRYGNTLLGLALALVHVDAWGAGPYLGVVPSGVALAVAALASAALAALAFASGEQALFAVGLGGALIAPFVTSTGGGSVPALLGYGLVVTAGACAALGSAATSGRRWTLARWIAAGGGAGYALAAIPLPAPPESWPLQIAPPAFALVCAWAALLLSGREHRVPLARTLLAASLFTLGVRGIDLIASGGPLRALVGAVVATALAGTATAFVVARLADEREDEALAVLWAVLLPLGFLFVALASLPETRGVAGAGVAGAWVLLSVAAAWAAPRLRRQPALVVAAAAAGVAVILGFDRHPTVGVAALAAVGALTAFLAARLTARGEPSRLLLFPSALALVGASLWAQALLDLRPAYRYLPFMTRPSLAALAAVAGWFAFAHLVSRTRWTEGAEGTGASARPTDTTLVASLGVVAAFLWGREELARAFSRDLATFLLIGYYAVAGVAAIFVGRVRTIPGARRVGLALAVYAALKALAQSAGLSDIVLRVGSFLLVGLFLLAVAYWYRATGEEEEREEARAATKAAAEP